MPIEEVTTRPTCSLIIPALNEGNNLRCILPGVPGFIDELIVVDGRSTDDTVAVARSLVPNVSVVAQSDRGKGDAVRAGLQKATGEWIFLMDADGSHSMKELHGLADGLAKGFDVVHGSRFLMGGGSEDLTPIRTVGNRLLTLATNLIHGSRFTDVCYGFMAMQRRVARSLRIECNDIIVEAEILCRVADSGYTVLEVPSMEHRRLSGDSHFHGLPVGLKNLGVILTTRFRPAAVGTRRETWTA